MMARKRTALTADALRRPVGGGLVRGHDDAVVLELDPRALIPNPFNPPSRSRPSEELAASIQQVGVLAPLLVVTIEEWVRVHGSLPVAAETPQPLSESKAQWVVLDGVRRHAAAVLAGQTSVPGIHRPDLVERVDEVILAANANRLSLTPYEEALGYRRLLDKGMTQAGIAAVQGVTQGQVAKRLKLLGLPAEIARHVQARGAFGVTDALQLLEFDDVVLDQLAAAFVVPDGTASTAVNVQARRVQQKLQTAAVEPDGVQIADDALLTDAQFAAQARWDFLCQHFRDTPVPQAAKAEVIGSALSRRRFTPQTYRKAAELAVSAGVLTDAEEWSRVGSLTVAQRLLTLLHVTAAHLRTVQAPFDADTAHFYLQLDSWGYQPTPWEQQALKAEGK